jgi:ribulose kinase
MEKWVIKYNPTSRYVSSKNVLVRAKELSRRFSSVKQAKAYIKSCGYDKTQCTVVSYDYADGETPVLTEKEVNRRIIFKNYKDFCVTLGKNQKEIK